MNITELKVTQVTITPGRNNRKKLNFYRTVDKKDE